VYVGVQVTISGLDFPQLLAGKPVWPSERVQSQYWGCVPFVQVPRPRSAGVYVYVGVAGGHDTISGLDFPQ
jgi:hypothetical protein